MKRGLVFSMVCFILVLSGCNYTNASVPKWIKKIFSSEKKYSEVSENGHGCIYIPVNKPDSVTTMEAVKEISRKLVLWENEFPKQKITAMTFNYSNRSDTVNNIQGEHFCFSTE